MTLTLTETELSQLNANLPWYKQTRLTHLGAFSKDKPPAQNNESWRQTPIKLFDLVKASRPSKGTVSISEYGDASVAAFKGVEFAINEDIKEAHKLILSDLLAESAEKNSDLAFTANLQKSTVGAVATLHISKSCAQKKPIHISYKAEHNDGSFSPLLLVTIEKGAQVSLIEELGSDLPALFMPRIEFIIEDGATLNFTSIQRLCESCQYLGRHNFILKRDANLNTVHIGTGSSVSRLDLDCNMVGENSSAVLNSFFVADKERHIDFHPTQNHLVGNCRSDLYSKYVLKDNARSVYYGYIKVAEDAQKTDAYQTNRNLLLSPTAKADTVPNLEIKANDVKCSHGASVGKVSPDELFYLATRGIPKEMAERLLVEGFFEDILGRIKDEEIRDHSRRIILERLDNGTTNSQA